MASVFSHAAVALAMGRAVQGAPIDRRALYLGMVCSVVPDLDVLGWFAGIDYGDLWGHRGLTHSLLFAALLSAGLVHLFYRGRPTRIRAGLGLYLFLCTASHGLLDALTDGGLGVAFFSPFDQSRYFLPVRPVAVSPIGLRAFFGEEGLRVLASEAVWIWLPTAAVLVVGRVGGWLWSAGRAPKKPQKINI